ncbi:MAG TPA: hypothetical protein VJ698_18690 [Noviherbaspirillum sp.]|uniref:hypothetical protein n=1 Tax=Noviherbaspirillum sp. TaxID=1926288 RepID=UPI002B4874FF|nr:hypothetical protein [Noviherbaspirillum sp.]HJV87504.1 hypothetical protein [Noviherbaspirillum sp.]
MGILGSMLGKKGPEVTYRTIDGGHPAPFPDMTDEQLYNYEMTFDVPHKTFDKPPVSPKTGKTGKTVPRPEHVDGAAEKTAQNDEPPARLFDAPRYSARAAAREQQKMQSEQQEQEPPVLRAPQPLDLTRPVRLVTSKQPVEIITTRARHPIFKVHGYIGDDNVVTVFTLEGQLSENGPHFLENVPEQRQLHLNIYLNPDRRSADKYLITQHTTEEEANAAATPGRLACIPVRFDLNG